MNNTKVLYMISPKQKPCKGTGKAIGTGCGNIQYPFRFGLCKQCYIDWLYSDAGKETLSKALNKSKKKVFAELKKEKQQTKENIKTKSDYEKELQTLVNWIVREIDKEKGCISCEHGWNKDFTRQRHAGHRLSIGSTHELRFNVHNIFGQCSICNNWLSGNQRQYDEVLTWAYGSDYYDLVLEQRKLYKGIKLTIPELKSAIQNAKAVQKKIKAGEMLSREQINKEIGIYLK